MMTPRQMCNWKGLSKGDDSWKLKLQSSLHNPSVIALEDLFFQAIAYSFSILGESAYNYHFIATMSPVIFMTFLNLLNFLSFVSLISNLKLLGFMNASPPSRKECFNSEKIIFLLVINMIARNGQGLFIIDNFYFLNSFT